MIMSIMSEMTRRQFLKYSGVVGAAVVDVGFGKIVNAAPGGPESGEGFFKDPFLSVETAEVVDGTVIVGEKNPITNRQDLDAIERYYIRQSFPNFPEELFNPDSEQEGRAIQDIRIANMKNVGEVFHRNLEIVISRSEWNYLNSKAKETGGNAATVLRKHADALTTVWNNSSPKINRRAYLKKIVIVDDSVVSEESGGWQVVNDKDFGWWANDRLNKIQGFMPFDIDSRWVLYGGWTNLLLRQGIEFEGVLVDYGLNHEITHHFPVGDNYVYSPADSLISQPDGSKTQFRHVFMFNDHMTSQADNGLTAPSSYFILFDRKINPLDVRTSQDTWQFEKDRDLYGKYYFDNFKIKITGLENAGINYIGFMIEPEEADQWGTKTLIDSQDAPIITLQNGDALIELTKEQQSELQPGFYLLLSNGKITLPIYIPRLLFETLAWKQLINDKDLSSYELNLSFNENFPTVLSSLQDGLVSNKDVDGVPKFDPYEGLTFYFDDVADPSLLPSSTFATANIDDQGNRYIISWGDPRTASPINYAQSHEK